MSIIGRSFQVLKQLKQFLVSCILSSLSIVKTINAIIAFIEFSVTHCFQTMMLLIKINNPLSIILFFWTKNYYNTLYEYVEHMTKILICISNFE